MNHTMTRTTADYSKDELAASDVHRVNIGMQLLCFNVGENQAQHAVLMQTGCTSWTRLTRLMDPVCS